MLMIMLISTYGCFYFYFLDLALHIYNTERSITPFCKASVTPCNSQEYILFLLNKQSLCSYVWSNKLYHYTLNPAISETTIKLTIFHYFYKVFLTFWVTLYKVFSILCSTTATNTSDNTLSSQHTVPFQTSNQTWTYTNKQHILLRFSLSTVHKYRPLS